MKVLYITWEAYGGSDVREEFDRRKYEVDEYKVSRKEDSYANQQLEQILIGKVSQKDYDFVFSWIFFLSWLSHVAYAKCLMLHGCTIVH